MICTFRAHKIIQLYYYFKLNLIIMNTYIWFCAMHISIQFNSILFFSFPFYSIPFYSILFHSIPFYSILFHSLPFCSILFHSIPFYSIPFHSIYSIQICSIQFNSIQFYFAYKIISRTSGHFYNVMYMPAP